MRVYAPYLGQRYPRVVNFISFEPTVAGNKERSQSELATSIHTPGVEGLDFFSSNELNSLPSDDSTPAGVRSPDGKTLSVFIRTERFPDGAEPIVRLRFDRDQPYEVEMATFASPASARIVSSVLSATMGNFGLLKRLHLTNGETTAADLWDETDRLDRLDFLPWRIIPAGKISRDDKGRYSVRASSGQTRDELVYHPSVAKHWHYVGKPASHTWKTEGTPVLAVNARRTYWRSNAPIPGGTTIENFELRTDFVPGQRFWFRIDPDA
ncbi:MAG: hypothetical protein LC739_08705 [Actinobacteria bacterium]|nr:hypothetical protein [Actinomycetota bacterium]